MRRRDAVEVTSTAGLRRGLALRVGAEDVVIRKIVMTEVQFVRMRWYHRLALRCEYAWRRIARWFRERWDAVLVRLEERRERRAAGTTQGDTPGSG
jgi:hypothetical protein